ncbi:MULTISPECIES: hypothetical protein [unclassified Methanosarcina]|nr:MULTISPECIES: hypothetical protein [unclassified Methanosarcina]
MEKETYREAYLTFEDHEDFLRTLEEVLLDRKRLLTTLARA